MTKSMCEYRVLVIITIHPYSRVETHTTNMGERPRACRRNSAGHRVREEDLFKDNDFYGDQFTDVASRCPVASHVSFRRRQMVVYTNICHFSLVNDLCHIRCRSLYQDVSLSTTKRSSSDITE